jgi:hypothetical protein
VDGTDVGGITGTVTTTLEEDPEAPPYPVLATDIYYT